MTLSTRSGANRLIFRINVRLLSFALPDRDLVPHEIGCGLKSAGSKKDNKGIGKISPSLSSPLSNPLSSNRPLIVVVNHKAANIHSVDKALQQVGANAVVSSSAADLASASAAVLPGVGSSDAAMRALTELDLVEPIKDFAASGRPLLGVCLGMQLLFDSSEEGDMPGLGLIPGEVKRMDPIANGAPRKIPHMGWNSVRLLGDAAIAKTGAKTDAKTDERTGDGAGGHPLFDGTPQDSYFYFVHSYECVPANSEDVLATTEYGSTLCAATGRGNVTGTQFHPEKSQDLGLRLYSNFLKMAASEEGSVRA